MLRAIRYLKTHKLHTKIKIKKISSHKFISCNIEYENASIKYRSTKILYFRNYGSDLKQ